MGDGGSWSLTWLRVFALALACGAWALPGPSWAAAVSPSQVTPSTLAPSAPPSSPVTIASPEGAPAPEGAEKLSITLGRVQVEGGFPDLEDETRAITAGIVGRRITLAAIYAAVGRIERAYAARGWALVRVAVPPQKLDKGGALKLVVIDGFIESIDVTDVPARQRALVAARAASLTGLRHVTLGEIERRLLLAADIPGLALTSTLARGDQPGGARLLLSATEAPVSGGAGFDNRLPASLGTYEENASLALNSLLGHGEQIYGSVTSGYNLGLAFDGRSPVALAGGGVSLPIGIDGFRINPEYTYSVTRPAPSPGAPASVGYYERFDLRAIYPWLLTRANTLNLQATAEWAQERLTAPAFGTDLYRDRYSAVRLQADDHMRLPFGALVDGTLTLSQGLGGRSAADAAASGVPLSQQGASPNFTKLNFDGRWTQVLPQGFQGIAIARAQTSFGRPLFVAEQFSLDGESAASAYPLGTFTVDEGATLRGEVAHPLSLGATTLSPYVFAEAGGGRVDQPTAVQQASVSAASFGVGVRGGGDLPGLPAQTTFAVELARGVSDLAGETQAYRCNFLVGVRF